MADLSPRPLPQWGWVLAVLFFPSGVFVAFGAARLLTWTRAILFALLSYGCIIGFVQFMMLLERNGASSVMHSVAILVGMVVFCAWAFFIFRIGQRAEYWSQVVQRGWRRAGWFAVVVLCLACLSLGLQFIVAQLHSP
jgi:uncharacterized membrane protein